MSSVDRLWLDNVIPVEIHRPEAHEPKGIVVTLHGLLSYRGSEKFLLLADLLSSAGFIAVRFDQFGAGENLERSAPTLIDGRLQDLRRVAEFLKEKFVDRISSLLPICLLGSSFGGYIAYLYAATYGNIQAIVSWATPFDVSMVRRFLTEENPFSGIQNKRDPLGQPDRLSILTSLSNVKNVLVLHGVDDEIVPWTEAQMVYDAVSDPKELILFDGVDHRFSDEEARRKAAELSVGWLVNCCSK